MRDIIQIELDKTYNIQIALLANNMPIDSEP
jgi:hypothetical protein